MGPPLSLEVWRDEAWQQDPTLARGRASWGWRVDGDDTGAAGLATIYEQDKASRRFRADVGGTSVTGNAVLIPPDEEAPPSAPSRIVLCTGGETLIFDSLTLQDHS